MNSTLIETFLKQLNKSTQIQSKFLFENTNHKDLIFLVNLFYSFELFKKYCGDFNVPKNELLFLELLSGENDWLFKNGLNIMIIENKDRKNYINCPLIEDPKDIYKSDRPSIIYKHENIFEPLAIVQAKQNDSLTYITQFSSDPVLSINQELFEKIKDIHNLINEKGNCSGSPNKISVYDLIQGNNIKYLLFDEFFKGIGVFTKENTILFTSNHLG